MSLLLDARKKSLQAQQAPGEVRTSEASEEIDTATPTARDAGRNLFAAKATLPSAGFALPARGLLIALAATVLLLAAGLGYLWRIDVQSSNPAPLHPIDTRIASQPPAEYASTAITREAAPAQSTDIPEAAQAADSAKDSPSPQQDTQSTPPLAFKPLRVERQRTETVDPLLEKAYLTYRDGKLDEAQQLYQSMLAKGTSNADALLGLAAIAQQRGENQLAAHYYSRVLTLDPRNAVANAGISTLSMDNGGDESRLKTLLREQDNSTSLHFALGNLFAGQSRWSEAQQAYFNAYTLESDNAEFAYNLAVSLDHLGQGKLAAQYYQRALQLDATGSPGFDHAQVARRIERLAQPDR